MQNRLQFEFLPNVSNNIVSVCVCYSIMEKLLDHGHILIGQIKDGFCNLHSDYYLRKLIVCQHQFTITLLLIVFIDMYNYNYFKLSRNNIQESLHCCLNSTTCINHNFQKVGH